EDDATRGTGYLDSVLRGVNFVPLPGTAREGKTLASAAARWNWSPRIYQGAQATKSLLQQIHSPHILHLATHGFFLAVPAQRPDGIGAFAISRPALANPMLRSGLALSGAQATIQMMRG